MPHGSAAGKKINTDTFVGEIRALEAAHSTGAQIDRVLADEWCITEVPHAAKAKAANSVSGSANSAVGSADSSTLYTADQENADAEVAGGIGIDSAANGKADADDTVWDYIKIYYSSSNANYFAAAEYHWSNHDYAADASSFNTCYTTEAIGNEDSVGIRLGTASGTGFATYGRTLYIGGDPALDPRTGDFSDYKHMPDNGDYNAYGTMWWVQDNTHGTSGSGTCVSDDHLDLDIHHGWVALEFDTFGNTHLGGVEPYADYSHTWSSGAINGFDVSANSFGIQWSNSDKGFNDPANCGCTYTLH